MKYRNIVMIDDDQDDREIFLEALKDVSSLIDCTAFTDGDIALEKLTEKAIAPDVIFLDLNMNRMSGFEFLEYARKTEALKEIPIIVYSTSTFIEASLGKLEGANGFISKPHNYLELVEILKSYIIK